MRAGRLDRRITIRHATETQSDSGETVLTWSDLATVWGEAVNMPGYERYAAQQTIGRALATYRIRYSNITNQITVKDRCIINQREYDITDVRETQRGEEIQIDCYTQSELPLAPPNLLLNAQWTDNNLTHAAGPASLDLFEDGVLTARFADHYDLVNVNQAGRYRLTFDYQGIGPSPREFSLGVYNTDLAQASTTGWSMMITDHTDPVTSLTSAQDFVDVSFLLESISFAPAADGWFTLTATFTIAVADRFYVWVNLLEGAAFTYQGDNDGSGASFRNLLLKKI